MSPNPLAAWSASACAAVDAVLASAFPTVWPERFGDAMRYPVFGGGKRVRPLLTLAAFEAVAPSSAREAALPFAAAVELVHTYSLVHDDLPAMDDDDVRRGRPTVHRAFDEATAILVGDALLTEAFSVLAAAPLPAATVVQAVALLAKASGHAGMVGGQAADIGLGASVQDVETLMRLHAGKTGALIHAAVRLGGLAGGSVPAGLAALDAYGHAVGLAFQLADDVLDADEADDPHGPPSYVRLLGLEATQRKARALVEEAIAAVVGLPNPERLIALARYTVERDV
jgi:geranylgeranyl diphosphate synthase type II